jgi:MoxR-like ATPase
MDNVLLPLLTPNGPGVCRPSAGKTTFAIQFTPDLMPADIIGTELLKDRAGTLEFEFRQGPDLRQPAAGRRDQPRPAEDPVGAAGGDAGAKGDRGRRNAFAAGPVPGAGDPEPDRAGGHLSAALEAQLDRHPFVTREEVLAVQRLVRSLPVSDHVVNYAVDLSIATRPGRQDMHPATRDYIEWGAGPRASQCLVLGAKAVALLRGRTAPETSDVREVALPVMQHRIITNYRATGANLKSTDVLRLLLQTVKERTYST